jgi:RHS repeat-associated protein
VTTPQWLHADAQGSTIAWSNATGGSLGALAYDPWGQPSSWSGPRYAYTGQLMLPEANLYHYKARAYSPGLGRFLQPDPAGMASDTNLYAYVGGDPVDGVDPSGMAPGDDIMTAFICGEDPFGCGGVPASSWTFNDNWPSVTINGKTIVSPVTATGLYYGFVPFQVSFNTGRAQSLGIPGGGGGGVHGPTRDCPKDLQFANGADTYAKWAQRAAGGIAVASLAPQIAGGPIDPLADLATGIGETAAGLLEASSLAASLVSGAINANHGNVGPLAATVVSAGLSAGSGVRGPAAHIAGTAIGEVNSAALSGGC